MKKFIKDYFTFSRKETYAGIVILLITAMFIALPYYFSNKKKKEPLDAAVAKVAAIQLAAKDSNGVDANDEYSNKYASNKYNNYNKTSTTSNTITPFEFDPNIIDEIGWHKLGLSDKLIKTILNYRGKGGSFRTPEDIRKIWGLKKEDADILVPYVTIAAKPSNNKFNNNYAAKTYEKPKPTIVDINTATVEEFRALPGVGNTAYKIVKYREKLGGFLNINQIKETYSLTDSVYQAMQPYLKFSSTDIQKLNINTLSDFELGKHPYISNDIAKAIAIYRKQKGNYSRVEDIKKIVFINQTTFQKIAPYLTVE
jgi:competence protein ComEA